jgi:hypothetical protein
MGANPDLPISKEEIFAEIGIVPGTEMCYSVLIDLEREGILINYDGKVIPKTSTFYIELQGDFLAS